MRYKILIHDYTLDCSTNIRISIWISMYLPLSQVKYHRFSFDGDRCINNLARKSLHGRRSCPLVLNAVWDAATKWEPAHLKIVSDSALLRAAPTFDLKISAHENVIGGLSDAGSFVLEKRGNGEETGSPFDVIHEFYVRAHRTRSIFSSVLSYADRKAGKFHGAYRLLFAQESIVPKMRILSLKFG